MAARRLPAVLRSGGVVVVVVVMVRVRLKPAMICCCDKHCRMLNQKAELGSTH
jgi:hypothetical protein